MSCHVKATIDTKKKLIKRLCPTLVAVDSYVHLHTGSLLLRDVVWRGSKY